MILRIPLKRNFLSACTPRWEIIYRIFPPEGGIILKTFPSRGKLYISPKGGAYFESVSSKGGIVAKTFPGRTTVSLSSEDFPQGGGLFKARFSQGGELF